jgi:hypothetical protein
LTSVPLFDRKYLLEVGDIATDEIDIDFRVTRSLKTKPNSMEIAIFNLNQENQQKLQQSKNLVARLTAGYKDRVGQIFFGEVRDVDSRHEGADWVTVLESGDGERARARGRINKSFAPGTRLSKVLKKLGKELPGVDQGNLVEALSTVGDPEFVNGVTVSGSAAREIDKLIKSAGLEWSIQDGAIQVLKAGEPLSDTAVVLTPETGLIGSPTVSAKGVLTCTALLNSDIVPGRQIVVKSRQVDGRYRAIRCDYDGSTTGDNWYVKIEGKEIKV